MIFRVLLVGLGRIGMGYDLGLPSPAVLSHARAFSQHPRFELAAAVDPDASKRATFQSVYGRPAYARLADVDSDLAPDVVVLAVPTAAHAEQLSEVLRRWSPRCVVCEKPLSYDLDEARQIVDACQSRGTRMFVNYMRRSDPGAIEIRDRIRDGRIAGPIKGVAWYSKGLLHNGSHFFNILSFWLGDTVEGRIMAAGRSWDALDPEPDLYLRFDLGSVAMLAAREEEFSYCAIELVATNGRLRYEQGGDVIIWTPRQDAMLANGCRELAGASDSIANEMYRYQWHVTDRLAAALDGEDAEICSGAEALATLEQLHSFIAMRTLS